MTAIVLNQFANFNRIRTNVFGVFDLALIANVTLLVCTLVIKLDKDLIMAMSVIAGTALCVGACYSLWKANEKSFIRFVIASLSLVTISLTTNTLF